MRNKTRVRKAPKPRVVVNRLLNNAEAAVSALEKAYNDEIPDGGEEELTETEAEPGTETETTTKKQKRKGLRNFASGHIEVYPPAPVPGVPVLPTGGLAICQCSPDCTRELPQPAYRNLTKDELARFFPNNEIINSFPKSVEVKKYLAKYKQAETETPCSYV